MKKLRVITSALSALALSAAIAWGAAFPLPGGASGPTLGDPASNLYTLIVAYIQGSGYGTGSGISASQTSGQSNCTQTGLQNMLHSITTSASTGYICLPTAISGRRLEYYNSTGQTINIYSSATSFTAGTADTINGTAGTTAYASLITGKNAVCFAYANGKWTCSVSIQ